MTTKSVLAAFCFLACGFAPSLAAADGLADLKTALARMQDSSAIQASIEATISRGSGEGKDAEDERGVIEVSVEDGPRGMQFHYGADMVARLDAETAAKESNAKSKTPALTALNALTYQDFRSMITESHTLQRLLARSRFVSEAAEARDGRPARHLRFDLSMPDLSEKDRKYLKKSAGTLDVWIAEDGTPLASQSRMSLSGRAFLVISFEESFGDDRTYARVGDRLVTTRREFTASGSGGGESDRQLTVVKLQIERGPA
jgi:hypothetical protein